MGGRLFNYALVAPGKARFAMLAEYNLYTGKEKW